MLPLHYPIVKRWGQELNLVYDLLKVYSKQAVGAETSVGIEPTAMSFAGSCPAIGPQRQKVSAKSTRHPKTLALPFELAAPFGTARDSNPEPRVGEVA